MMCLPSVLVFRRKLPTHARTDVDDDRTKLVPLVAHLELLLVPYRRFALDSPIFLIREAHETKIEVRRHFAKERRPLGVLLTAAHGAVVLIVPCQALDGVHVRETFFDSVAPFLERQVELEQGLLRV